MTHARKAAGLAIIFFASTALAQDQVPVFKAGEWQIEITQDGGATYKDSKQESGTSSVAATKPTQVVKRCFKDNETRLAPESFVMGCAVSNVTYSGNEMKADISCPNRSMTMTGNIRMTVMDNGTKMSGFQFLSGGGEAVGAIMMSNIKMTHLGKCKN